MIDLRYDIPKKKPRIREVLGMQILDDLRYVVCFLFGSEWNERTKNEEKYPIGTGFFVSAIQRDSIFVYVVTACHVLNDFLEENKTIYLRINSTEGHRDIPVSPQSWVRVTQYDVAVLDLGELGDQIVDCYIDHLPISMLATPQYIKNHNVTWGDEVFHVGMFAGHYGEDFIQPIARFGRIALMPEEKITIDIGANERIKAYAYLIDMVAMGGASGSPVFIYYPPDRTGILPPDSLSKTTVEQQVLGFVQGYYDEKVTVNKRGDKITLNQGIGIVIPASVIWEVLMQDKKIVGRRK